MADSPKSISSSAVASSSSSDFSDDDFKLPSSSKSKFSKQETPIQGTSSSIKLKEYDCDQCPYKSHNISNFKRHKSTHKCITHRTKKTFSCASCSYHTTKSSSWIKHLNTKQHLKLSGVDVKTDGKFKCPEIECRFQGQRMEILRLHVENEHSKSFEKEELTFENEEAFKVWKNELHANDSVKFIRTTGSKGNSRIYECHRSGTFQPKGNNLREMKKRGSVKCGRVCLARIVVRMNELGCKVDYWKKHVGHSIDPGKVGIPSPQKRELAARMKEGIPKLKILQNMQSTHIETIKPISLLTNQDLSNIARKHGVAGDIILHQNDAESIHQKYMLMKQSGDDSIFFYKPYGEVSQDYPTLRKEEFVLAYMNNGQEHMIKTQGKEIICIDSTHGTNAYNFEMTTIMTIDDEFQGFPVAFFFHSSKTQETYINFITALQRRVGTIHTSVFMSDDEPAFYNAWKQVMGRALKKLLCSWHVIRNWSKKLGALAKVGEPSLHEQLHAVMYQLNTLEFEMGFQTLLRTMQENPTMRHLHPYFLSYWNRKEEWAYCYRTHAGINTNMMLERFHLEIKTKYFKGKKVKRLDVGFNGVLEYLKQRQYDRIVSDYRGKVSTKDHLLRTAHKRSFEGNLEFIATCGDGYTVRSFTNMYQFYNVQKNISNCACETRCTRCCQCIHSFTCSCIESSIRSNMCKHIHLLCRFILQTDEQQDISEDDCINELVVDTNKFSERRHEEMESHLLDLRSVQASSADVYTNETCASAFERAIEIASDADDYKLIQDCLLQAMDTIRAKKSALESFPMSPKARTQPGNANAEKQHRYFPKKKPRQRNHPQKDHHAIMTQLLPIRMQSANFSESFSELSPHEHEVVVYNDEDLPIEQMVELETESDILTM